MINTVPCWWLVSFHSRIRLIPIEPVRHGLVDNYRDGRCLSHFLTWLFVDLTNSHLQTQREYKTRGLCYSRSLGRYILLIRTELQTCGSRTCFLTFQTQEATANVQGEIYCVFLGMTIVGGKVVTGGSKLAAVLREFWMRSWSMTTNAAMPSTMGTARGTTQGSCLPRAARVPGVPSYWAVSCG